MIHKVYRMLSYRVTPPVETEDLVSERHCSVAFKVGGLAASTNRPLQGMKSSHETD